MSGLVYRVHAVPETVNDFLFDFGVPASGERSSERLYLRFFPRSWRQALTQKAEKMYIRSMVPSLHSCVKPHAKTALIQLRWQVLNAWPESHEREQELVTELLCLAQVRSRPATICCALFCFQVLGLYPLGRG